MQLEKCKAIFKPWKNLILVLLKELYFIQGDAMQILVILITFFCKFRGLISDWQTLNFSIWDEKNMSGSVAMWKTFPFRKYYFKSLTINIYAQYIIPYSWTGLKLTKMNRKLGTLCFYLFINVSKGCAKWNWGSCKFPWRGLGPKPLSLTYKALWQALYSPCKQRDEQLASYKP